jgi:hypothetical protein
MHPVPDEGLALTSASTRSDVPFDSTISMIHLRAPA